MCTEEMKKIGAEPEDEREEITVVCMWMELR